MKKLVSLMTIMALFMVMPVQAQKGHKGHKKVGAKQKIMIRKMQYLKQKLLLNQKEAENFEAAYKTYMKKKADLNKKFKTEFVTKVRKGNLSEMSEKEKQAIIKNKLNFDQELYDLDRDFTQNLIKILPSEKVISYFKYNRQFKRELMKRFKARHKGAAKKHKKMKRK